MAREFPGARALRTALEAAGYSVLQDENTIMAGGEGHALVIRSLGGRTFHVMAAGQYGMSETRSTGAQAAVSAALAAARTVMGNPAAPEGRRKPRGTPIRRPAKRSSARRRDRP